MIQKNIITLFFLTLTIAVFGQASSEEVSVTNIRILNTADEDFVAVPYGEGIIYNTNVKDNKCDTCRFQNLRYAALEGEENCSFSAGAIVPNNLEAKYNYGAATFSSDGSTMIISQNNKKPRQADRRITLKLTTATKNDRGEWKKAADLPFNSIEFETTHPSLSADGQTLYFASDRPGGMGGMDIWKVSKEGETWGTPVNLGAPINSQNNELFPSISANGTLFYASNKAGGMGGLDIYEATMSNNAWTSVNLGAPFNSRSDDLGYVELPDGESGYLTSDRAGGQGKDDLYCWHVNPAPVDLAVEDATNANRLAGAMVNIVGRKATLDYTTDASGITKPAITYRRTYTINVEKEGYEPWSKEVTAKELAMAKPYIVPLTPRAYTMVGDVKLLGKEEVVPGAKIVLHNLTTGEKREVIADANGKFSFDNIRCFEDYELIAYKSENGEEVSSETYPLPATMIDCNSDQPTEVTLRLPEPKPLVLKCPTYEEGMLSLPENETPKTIHILGSRPQFGNVHDLDAAGFYTKLKRRYDSSRRDAAFLDELFTALGYPNGFADANETTFYATTIPNGMVGNMGYTKRHRIKYVQLDAKRDRDLQAFKVAAINGCDVYFMKTCGNIFFFRQ